MMISVIVPVYNVEKYLNKCIDSIINQSYKDFELILVDDGSTDNSPQICDIYASAHENIHVIHKNNGGLSDARNTGICIAKGKYVVFIDSDDFIDSEFLKVLIEQKEEYGADISCVAIGKVNEGNEPNFSVKSKVFCCSGLEAIHNMLYQKILDTSASGILLPISIVRENLFPVNKFHEDDFTTYKYYFSATKVIINTRPMYYYLQRNNSIMHTTSKKSQLDEIEAIDEIVAFCEKKDQTLLKAAYSKKFSNYCQILLQAKLAQDDILYKKTLKYLNEKKLEILLDSKVRLKNKIAALCLCVSDSLFIFIYKKIIK